MDVELEPQLETNVLAMSPVSSPEGKGSQQGAKKLTSGH